MSARRDSVTIDDAFHATLIALSMVLMGAAALSLDVPTPPDGPAVSLRASVHPARSLPDI